jgi:hypothetical protein
MRFVPPSQCSIPTPLTNDWIGFKTLSRTARVSLKRLHLRSTRSSQGSVKIDTITAASRLAERRLRAGGPRFPRDAFMRREPGLSRSPRSRLLKLCFWPRSGMEIRSVNEGGVTCRSPHWQPAPCVPRRQPAAGGVQFLNSLFQFVQQLLSRRPR